MMDDLIYRSGVAQAIETAQRSLLTDNDALWENNRKYHKGLAWSRRIIDKAPAVDAVEVVYCKDCIRWKCYGKSEPHMGDCLNMKKWDGFYKTMFDCDYCSEGERREDDE